jgi:hypothetical protein
MMSFGLVFLVLLGQEGIPLDLPGYRASLGTIRTSLEAGDLPAARELARSLAGRPLAFSGREVWTDRGILRDVEKVEGPSQARELLPRLGSLIEGLRDLDPSAPPGGAPDPVLLARLRQEQREREARRGGELSERPGLDVPPSILDRLQAAWDWIWDLGARVIRWLIKFLFSTGASNQAPSDRTPLFVSLLVLLVIGGLAAIALVAWRRKGAGAGSSEAVSEASPMSPKDEDPLSRTATEWELLAAELTQAGRFREAMRAWYHAVLVTLFRSGVLHYRRDRTNWEYAHSLSPELAWRPGFLEATRGFERVWYGRRDAPAEMAQAYAREARSILDRVRGGGAR